MHTIFLSLLAILTFLALPPELGRLEEIRRQGLLVAFLAVETVLVAYLTSACACGEIGIEGEKSVWDLATSPFPAAVIATGKVVASGAFALILVALASPFMAVVAGIRGEPVAGVLRASVVTVPFAGAMGALAVLYGAVFDSDFARSFVHWMTLLALIVGAMAFPAPWDLLSPVRAVAMAARTGAQPAVLAIALGYVLVSTACWWGIRSRVEAMRREARA